MQNLDKKTNLTRIDKNGQERTRMDKNAQNWKKTGLEWTRINKNKQDLTKIEKNGQE